MLGPISHYFVMTFFISLNCYYAEVSLKNAFMLIAIMPSGVVLCDIIPSVVILCAIMPKLVMFSGIIPSVVILCAIMPKVVKLSD
jgi:hypothetical protein